LNTGNVFLVVLLVFGIVILANLAMFAMVRGSRGMRFDWFKNVRGSFGQPFKKEGDSLDELHRKVEELKSSEKKD
jgi:hypothetical protein